jgi:hypothetical protein
MLFKKACRYYFNENRMDIAEMKVASINASELAWISDIIAILMMGFLRVSKRIHGLRQEPAN